MASKLVNGKEVMNPTPKAPPVKRTRQVGEVERMRDVVLQMQREAEDLVDDTEVEERDFHVEEDQFPESQHERFVESESYELLKSDLQEFDKQKRKRKKAEVPDPSPEASDAPKGAASEGAERPPANKPDESA